MTVGAGFVLLSLAMAAALVAGAWAAGPAGRPWWTLATAAVAGGALAVSGLLAATGVLLDLDARPPPLGLMLLAFGVGTVALAFSRLGDRLLGLPLAVLVGVQAFRIPVELLLAAAYADGVVPAEMTYHGHNFDVVTGVLALGLGVWLWRGTVPRGVVAAWNGLGLVLLAIVVVTAALSGFGILETTPRLRFPSTWPGVWLPAWLVQLALLGHLLVVRALRRERASAPGA